MLLWLNGTFGAGKTTTARAVVARSESLRIFDAEHVGYMLMANLQGIEVSDFQDLSAWRKLVPIVARQLEVASGQQLVVVQTVLNRGYWAELRAGLAEEGIDVLHVVLDIERQELVRRIESDENDPGAMQWRLDHVQTFEDSRNWMLSDADLVVDVSVLSADEAADLIVRVLG